MADLTTASETPEATRSSRGFFNNAGLVVLAPLLAVAGVAGDQVFNNGNLTDSVLGDTGIGREVGRVGDGLREGFGKAAAVGGELASVVGAVTRSPEGNPWMQGLGALTAFSIAWSAMPWLMSKSPLLNSDIPFVSSLMRGVVGIACAGAAAYAAAVAIGLVRDDPEAPAPAAYEPATEDPRLGTSAAAPPRLDFSPGV